MSDDRDVFMENAHCPKCQSPNVRCYREKRLHVHDCVDCGFRVETRVNR